MDRKVQFHLAISIAHTIMLTPSCYTVTWRQHKGEVLGFLEHRTGCDSEAEDLLQEIFLKVLLQGKSFCELDNPRAWLFRVARNLLIDRQRLANARAPLLPLGDTSPDDFPAVSAPEVEPIDLLSHCLPGVLSRLAEKDREAIQLCDMQGITPNDYAKTTGLTVSAAKSRLQRARLRLRSLLAKACQVSYDSDGKVCCFVTRSTQNAARDTG